MHKWLRLADLDAGKSADCKPGATTDEREELRRLRRRNRALEQKLEVMLRVLKIARQPYCRWLANPVTGQDWAEAHRLNALIDPHRDDPEFGYRYLADTAEEDTGVKMAHRTAGRLCHSQGVFSVISTRKKGKVPAPGHRFTMTWCAGSSAR